MKLEGINLCLGNLVSLSLLSLDPLEFVHVCGSDGSAHYREVVDLGHLASLLVVLDEKLEICHILELDELEGDWSAVQLTRCQPR